MLTLQTNDFRSNMMPDTCHCQCRKKPAKNLNNRNEFVTYRYMREIAITEFCLDFIEKQGKRVSDKFFQLILIMEEYLKNTEL